MAITKITFDDKVSTIVSSLPRKNRITDTDINEIKEAINNNAEVLETIQPAVAVTSDSATLSISGSETASGTITLTNEGYYPAGLGGIQCSSVNLRLMAVYISNAANGTCTVSYTYRNTITTAGTPTVTAYVNWIKIN